MIDVAGVSRRYGDFLAVDDVSFSIGRGEIVGLLGHNGAGKTTIMKMMTGFLESSAGCIRIDGQDIAANRRPVQGKIGYLPENCPVYPDMTVAGFLDYCAALHGVPPNRRWRVVRAAIAETDLGDKAAEPIATLSRGFRQRVGVAQAILHRPQIFILDEPTNGLDPMQITHMRDLVRRLAESATVILSTHILQEVQVVCDRVIIIRNGRVALDSRLSDLRPAGRMVVVADRAEEWAGPVLRAAACVLAVDRLDGSDDRHRYKVHFSGSADDAAAAIAAAILGGGLRLFALHPEQRDLEAVFSQINEDQINGGREMVHV